MDVQDFLTGIVAFFLLAVIGVLSLHATGHHRATMRFQLLLFLGAFAIRLLGSVVLYGTGLHTALIGDGDHTGWVNGVGISKRYEESALWPLGILSGISSAFIGINKGYYSILGCYFYLTRLSSQLSAATLNCFCGAMTAVIAYRLARILFSEWVAVRAGWWTALFPLMIIWSTQTVKEPIVILLEAMALYSCVLLRIDRTSIRHVVLCGFSILGLLSLRFYAAYILGAIVLVSLALPQLGRGRIAIGPTVGVGLFFLVGLTLLSGSLQGHADFFDTVDLNYAENFRDAVATGQGSGSGVKVEHDLHTTRGFGLSAVIGGAHLLLAPFPWQLGGGSVRMLLVAPEMLVWWYLVVVGLVPGLRYVVRHRLGDVLPILLFLAGLGLIYSLMFGNIGIIYRQRAQLLPYLLIFAAAGLELRRLRRGVIGPISAQPSPVQTQEMGVIRCGD
ncbi:hypothetical protein BH23PLA1_BH23PLA1_43790 [soil metagenome]